MNRFDRIALIGGTGSGKTTAARWLRDNRGYQLCSTGEVCRRVAGLLFENPERIRLHEVSAALERLDASIFLHAAWRGIDELKPVVVDSLRNATDLSFAQGRSFMVLRMTAPEQMRASRLKAR